MKVLSELISTNLLVKLCVECERFSFVVTDVVLFFDVVVSVEAVVMVVGDAIVVDDV